MAASDARLLATRLAVFDDAVLAALLDARGISAAAPLADLYDLAETLLEPASIARGLERLTHVDAGALQTVPTEKTMDAGATERLKRLALVGDDGRLYGAVAAVLASMPRATATGPLTAPQHDRPGPENEAHAAERAFTAVASLADVLQSAATTPLTRIGSGALGAAERRRLVDAGAVGDADTADVLVEIAERAGLLAAHDREVRLTPGGRDWLATATATRWATVAEALRATLPEGLRATDGGWTPLVEWPGAYPFDPLWPAAAARRRRLLEQWAVVGPDGSPSPWAAALARGGAVDEAALATLLPPEVDRVFLQNDLTAIAPGPLAPEIGLRLQRIARRESRAQASTYRFTAETLAAALSAGETAESLRSFLLRVSLTGIPQPLAYEIERSAARHGGVRVGADEAGRTRVTGDAALIAAAGVDQSLRPLGLVHDGEGLVTRSSPETAFWMLADARYPVIAVGPDGAPRTVTREVVTAPASVPTPLERYGPLIARLRAAHGTGSDAAWLTRELEQAVRERAAVAVDVLLPDGTIRTLTMELTGIGGGRLRGLDRGADVERTLPVASIRAVRPA